MSEKKHICVCVCTYKRPQLIKRLLVKLQNQSVDGLFTFSVVVVDNDLNLSAKLTVNEVKEKSIISIDYHSEPEQNISLARNKAIENSTGDFIAFIDDDEFPTPGWLVNLFNAYHKYEADAVLGPVKPHFDAPTPRWLIKSKLCERKSYKSGTILNWKQTRTGNVLLDRDIFKNKNNRFEPEFGRTGGGDNRFFRQISEQGRIIVWCNEAIVYETVVPKRWKKLFYIKKFLRIGGLTGKLKKKREPLYIIRFISAFFFYMLLLPFSPLFGQHLFMRFLLKIVYYFGCISGYFGYVFIKNRDDSYV